MSKTTKSPSGTFSVSGGASASSKNGNTSYKMAVPQQDAYDYALKSFAEGLKSLNVFSPETIKSLNDEVEAYQNKALKTLNSLYQPMIQQTMEDSAKRFGNLDNSVYLQNLNKVEDQRANAISDLAQDVTSKQTELKNQELQNRYDYLNFLNNFQNQVFSNALNASNAATSSARNAYSNSANNSDAFANIVKLAMLGSKLL